MSRRRAERRFALWYGGGIGSRRSARAVPFVSPSPSIFRAFPSLARSPDRSLLFPFEGRRRRAHLDMSDAAILTLGNGSNIRICIGIHCCVYCHRGIKPGFWRAVAQPHAIYAVAAQKKSCHKDKMHFSKKGIYPCFTPQRQPKKPQITSPLKNPGPGLFGERFIRENLRPLLPNSATFFLSTWDLHRHARCWMRPLQTPHAPVCVAAIQRQQRKRNQRITWQGKKATSPPPQPDAIGNGKKKKDVKGHRRPRGEGDACHDVGEKEEEKKKQRRARIGWTTVTALFSPLYQ